MEVTLCSFSLSSQITEIRFQKNQLNPVFSPAVKIFSLSSVLISNPKELKHFP